VIVGILAFLVVVFGAAAIHFRRKAVAAADDVSRQIATVVGKAIKDEANAVKTANAAATQQQIDKLPSTTNAALEDEINK
jgi:cell division protein FtsB